jgi:transposase InsO family protein
MEELLTMNAKERERLRVMTRLEEKTLTQTLAAKQLGVTDRQVRRLLQAHKEYGDQGLVSKRRGRPSNNKLAEELKSQAVQIIRAHYLDFRPTLTHEKLKNVHHLPISITSVRKLMIEHGIWQPGKKKPERVYKHRPRRPCLGELIQMDGSYHDWFEGRTKPCCLLVAIDDATSRLMHLEFVEWESSFGYFRVLKKYLSQYGRPISLYTDKLSTFETTRRSEKEFKDTQFHRAMKQLGIELILAHSPQAKGRVERANGILQDRLIKEMRLQGISSMEEANSYLPSFIKAYNERFGKKPASPIDAHRPLTEDCNLDRILCLQHERIIAKDLTVSWQGKIYQIISSCGHHNLSRKKVLVLECEGGIIELIYKNTILPFVDLQQEPASTNNKPSIEELLKNWKSPKGHKPREDHPWKHIQNQQDRNQWKVG